jgi:hypothetical protein
MTDDAEHCYNCGGTYDWRSGDVLDDGDCVHCECCCTCLGCEYGPRNGLGMTDEQRAGARAIADDGARHG